LPSSDASELLSRLEKLRTESPCQELITTLNDLASLEFRKDPLKTEKYASEALELALKLGLERERGISLRMLGVSHWARSNYIEAITFYNKSLEIFDEVDDRLGAAAVYNNIGVVYLEQGAMDQALEHFLLSLRIKEECNATSVLAHSYINVANIYNRLERCDEALAYYNMALELHKESGNKVKIADCYNNMGLVYKTMNDLDKALDFINKSLELRKDTDDPKGVASNLNNIGDLYLELGDHDKALEHFEKSLVIREKKTDMWGIANSCTNAGRACIILGKLDRAEKYLSRAMEVTRDIGARFLESDCNRWLSELYEKKGDLKRAISCAREYNRIAEEYTGEDNRNRMTRMQVLFETERRDRIAEIYQIKNVELENIVETRTKELREVNAGLGTEIDERKRAEEARFRAESDLSSFLDNVQDMVYFQALDGSVSHLNSACISVTGYDRLEFDKAPGLWMRIIHPDDIEYRLEFLGYGHDKPLVSNHEYQLITKDSDWRWIHSHMVAIRDNDGVIIGYNCIDRDFTVRKDAEKKLQRSFYNLEKSFQGTIFTMSKIVETRDPYTSGHQMRTARLAKAIARQMGLSDEQVQTVFLAAVVHDIGKISIPQEYLSKPGKLNELEMQLIRAHPKVSYEVLSGIEFPWPIADIVLQHHEHCDGSGYPQGLTCDDIAIEARILCVADVVEAMSSHRPYRPKLGERHAMRELIMNRGILYDSDAVDACSILLKGCNFNLEQLEEPEREESLA